MYKKLLALLLTGFAALPLFAQSPTITSQQFFQAGKAYPYMQIWAQHQSVGTGGAGVVWDFSGLVLQGFVDTTVSVAPAATPAFLRCGIAGADTATICLLTRSSATYRDEDYHYYLPKGGKLIETGSDQDNGVSEDVDFRYSRPRTFSPMPFTYGTVSVDSFQSDYYSYLSGPHATRGVDSFVADGYGTLKVAGVTYINCVRLKQVSTWVDNNALMGTQNHRYERYTWYSTGKEGPVLTMESDTHTGVVANYYLPPNAPAGVDHVRAGDLFTLYPNPAANQVHLHFKSAPETPLQLMVFNMLGQVVLTRVLSAQDNRIDISGLAKGAYGCRLGDRKGSQAAATFIRQ